MPLFPAYAAKDVENFTDLDPTESQDMVWEATESREAQLLASDTEEEAPPRPPAPPPSSDDFYMDCKLDRGNLRVSTLYYPGRPQYNRGDKLLSGRGGRGGHLQRERRRYWAKRAPDAPDCAAAAERAAAYRRLLLERPHDLNLWEKFIDFQEICAGAEATLQAAEEACARMPRSGRLRARLLSATRAALPRERLLQRLRDLLAAEKDVERRVELWEQLIAEAGAAGGPSARAAAAAAVADTRALPAAYPRLLHAYGVFLRLGGLWEELVLLVELLAAMTFPPAAFPPAPPSPERAEQRLAELEDQILASGLPLSTIWVRVERARAAAHWRPAAGAAGAGGADPQRAPLPHDLADLLQPLPDRARLQLCATLLRLAKVPAMPGGAAALAWGAPAADCAESLLPLLRAARRLPPAHPARPAPAAARRLLALLLDPPHYFSDDSGYLSWVRALWDACCGWAGGEELLCWRLRWLHALALLADPLQEDGAREIQRIRDEARAALKRFGGGSPLAFAQFARIERVAAGEGGAGRAGRVALRALRAATLGADTPVLHALHVARIVCEETAGDGGELSAAGACALLSAVCGRALPAEGAGGAGGGEPRAPSAADLRAALLLCEERCAELERQFEAEAEAEREGEAEGEGAEGEGAEGRQSALPGAGEWAAARALLAAPARRAALLRDLLARAQSGQTRACGAAGARYWEQAACALAAALRGRGAGAARALARHFPHNAYLALASAGAPLWAAGALPLEERVLALRARSPCAALAAPLPALLRALHADWPPLEAEACARALRRAEERAGGAGDAGGVRALLGAARLEAEGRAPRPRLPHALYAALDAAPAAKWVHVRGAAWCAGEAGALADLLLHRQLRTHALLDELAV